MNDFTNRALTGAFVAAAVINFGLPLVHDVKRGPSSVDTYELSVSNIALDQNSRIHELKDVFLRATFAQNRTMEFGRNEGWKIARGESRPTAVKIDIDPTWILRDDTMEFRLELVEKGTFDTVVLRSSQIAREVTQYNRGYQCAVPGENTPVITYRLAKKGAPAINVAQGQ